MVLRIMVPILIRSLFWSLEIPEDASGQYTLLLARGFEGSLC